MIGWRLSSGFDPKALAVVDGLGRFAEHGPHYSRRSPGAKSFTGVGREIVLLSEDGAAVWAVVYQKTPSARGTGVGPGRSGVKDPNNKYVWRNMLFRNLGSEQSSALIRQAVLDTYTHWFNRYGALPAERLRTEVDTRKVKSRNPGYCYLMAGWEKQKVVRHKLYLLAPCPGQVRMWSE